MPGNHGHSQYISGGSTLVGEVEYMDFAPMPCVCLTCCANTIQQGRTYTRVYDNRFEQNKPFAVCGVCTPLEICIIDFVKVRYFDKAPNVRFLLAV